MKWESEVRAWEALLRSEIMIPHCNLQLTYGRLGKYFKRLDQRRKAVPHLLHKWTDLLYSSQSDELAYPGKCLQHVCPASTIVLQYVPQCMSTNSSLAAASYRLLPEAIGCKSCSLDHQGSTKSREHTGNLRLSKQKHELIAS